MLGWVNTKITYFLYWTRSNGKFQTYIMFDGNNAVAGNIAGTLLAYQLASPTTITSLWPQATKPFQ